MEYSFKTFKQSLTPPYNRKDLPRLLVIPVLLVGVIGTAAFINKATSQRGHAATLMSTVEAEAGTLSGSAAVGTDPGASGGQYVRFGAAGPSLYVAVNGSDSNDCTQAAPCKTFAHADSLATPGVTVHVAAGDYTGPITVQAAGTATARVRWVSDDHWGAKLSGGVVLVEGDYSDFEGFDVSGAGSASNEVLTLVGNYSRAISNNVHDLGVGCTQFGSNGGSGINAEGGESNYLHKGMEITGNYVHDIGAGPRDGTCRLVHGIYASVPDVKIINNVVVNAVGDGITSWHGATNLTIVNNTSYANGGNGILIGTGDNGATSAGNQNGYIANNISVSNAIAGYQESTDGAHSVSDAVYNNNLAYDNYWSYAPSSNYNHAAPGDVAWNGVNTTNGTVANMIVADPLVINVAANDYHLQATSPAIDKGVNTNAPTTDFDGTARPQGPGFDVGAYEFH